MEQHRFAPDGGIPNSRLPLLFAPDALPKEFRSPAEARRLLERNGWTGTWTYTVFPFWHFHTQGHEALACVVGQALIGFGGEGGIKVRMTAGDVCLVPAGVGHKRLEGSGDFLVAGGYPPGQRGDIARPGGTTDAAVAVALDKLALPETDPITGDAGEMIAAWRAAVVGS